MTHSRNNPRMTCKECFRMNALTLVSSIRSCVAAVIVSSLPVVFGQIPTGSLQGNVTDPTSAAIQGAEVLLQNEQTGILHQTKTNDQGLYTFNYLESGAYRLNVKATGFQTAVYPGISVQVGQKIRVDVPVAIGDVNSTVEVFGGAALVETDTAAVGSIVSRREVTEMPVRGREFSQLAALLPGVRATGSTGGALITQFATALTVGGTSNGKNGYTVVVWTTLSMCGTGLQ